MNLATHRCLSGGGWFQGRCCWKSDQHQPLLGSGGLSVVERSWWAHLDSNYSGKKIRAERNYPKSLREKVKPFFGAQFRFPEKSRFQPTNSRKNRNGSGSFVFLECTFIRFEKAFPLDLAESSAIVLFRQRFLLQVTFAELNKVKTKLIGRKFTLDIKGLLVENSARRCGLVQTSINLGLSFLAHALRYNPMQGGIFMRRKITTLVLGSLLAGSLVMSAVPVMARDYWHWEEKAHRWEHRAKRSVDRDLTEARRQLADARARHEARERIEEHQERIRDIERDLRERDNDRH
jgi:hypothetical protein